MDHITMKDMPEELRPYERLRNQGPDALSDAELLSIILNHGRRGESALGMAERILSSRKLEGEGKLFQLLQLSQEELEAFEGIGFVKAIRIRAVAEIGRRYSSHQRGKLDVFSEPSLVAEYFYPRIQNKEKEEVYAVWLDNRLQVKGQSLISIGSVNQTTLSPREVFSEGLTFGAVRLILVHNHPSGDPTPSMADISITRQIKEAGVIMNMELVDHIVIGNHCYFSMNEHELLE